jgi:hypothetical protein
MLRAPSTMTVLRGAATLARLVTGEWVPVAKAKGARGPKGATAKRGKAA